MVGGTPLQSLDGDTDWRWLAGFFLSTADRNGNDTRRYIVPLGGGFFCR